MNEIRKLIAGAHGIKAANAHFAFKPNEAAVSDLEETGRKLLSVFPPLPGACIMMSALYAVRLCANSIAPAYVVTGSLWVGQNRVFGDGTPISGATDFSNSDLSWNGHAWIEFGDRIADVSLFRTAYSKKSPPVLAAHVVREFGKGRGLFICKTSDDVKSGLEYDPEYVLNQDQVSALARSALAFLQN